VEGRDLLAHVLGRQAVMIGAVAEVFV
jgi:hypothetical protein